MSAVATSKTRRSSKTETAYAKITVWVKTSDDNSIGYVADGITYSVRDYALDYVIEQEEISSDDFQSKYDES